VENDSRDCVRRLMIDSGRVSRGACDEKIVVVLGVNGAE